jgi:uncharacterized protein
VMLTKRLELHTGFESLLPENKPSVKELKRVGARTSGVSTFIVVMEGSKKEPLQKIGDAVLPKLRALGPEWVGTAENGVQAEKEFLRQRQALFLSYDKVKEIHDKIEDRYDFEVHGSLTGDEPEPITRASIEKELGGPQAAAGGPPYPDGYYMNVEGTRLVTLIRTAVEVGDLPKTAILKKKVEDAIASVNPTSLDPAFKYGFTGDLVVGAEQYGVVKDDLAAVGAAGILMILFVDWLFFLRVRAVVAMGVAIGIGVLWCFALTQVVIGHLNTASGFLVSIVFGNGINFGILLRARYNEARRDGQPCASRIATRGSRPSRSPLPPVSVTSRSRPRISVASATSARSAATACCCAGSRTSSSWCRCS